MRRHVTITILLAILAGVAGCMTSNGAPRPPTQTTNGAGSSGTGGGGMGGGGGY